MELLFIAFTVIGVIMMIAMIVLAVIGTWRTLEKAGVYGWVQFIPIYGKMKLFELAGLPKALALLVFIMPAYLIITKIARVKVLMKFGLPMWICLFDIISGCGFFVTGFNEMLEYEF